MKIGPYLFFDGNCAEAMTFYKNVFGGELTLLTYKQQIGDATPPGFDDRIMHARLHQGDFELLASDCHPQMPVKKGDTVELSVHCDSVEQLEDLFTKLSVGVQAEMPPHDSFWGARFAKFKDQFGMDWMLNFDQESGK